MPSLSSSLAADLALLRSTAPAVDDRGWLPASLHALIAAIFARIFERLEQLLQLWQSGDLPNPSRQPTAEEPRTPRITAGGPQSPRHRTKRARSSAIARQFTALIPATPPPPGPSSHRPTVTGPQPPHTALARRQKPPQPPPQTHVNFITITY